MCQVDTETDLSGVSVMKIDSNKFWIAVSAACGVATSVAADGHVSLPDALAIVSAFAGALGVWKVSNSPKA